MKAIRINVKGFFLFLAIILFFALSGSSVQSVNQMNERLRQAIQKNNFDYLEQNIIRKDRLGTAVDRMGNTALILAARLGNVKIANYLIDHGATTEQSNDHGVTPLITAVSSGHLDVVKLLLKSGSDPNQTFQNTSNSDLPLKPPLFMAVEGGHNKVVDILLEYGADPNITTDKGKSPLYFASCRNRLTIMESLVNAGANVGHTDHYGWTPLHCAVKFSQYEAARFLLARGANPNHFQKNGLTALHVAGLAGSVFSDQSKQFQLNVTSSLDELRNKKIVWELLLNGAWPNNVDDRGNTPLHYFIHWANSETLRPLLRYGANPFLSNQSGTTPLQIAHRKRGNKIIELLLLENLNTQIRPIPHRLHQELVKVIDDGKTERRNQLISFGANPNYENLTGWTPLLRAVEQGRDGTALFLIVNGADPCRQNKWDINAYDIDRTGMLPGPETRCAIPMEIKLNSFMDDFLPALWNFKNIPYNASW